MGRILAVDCYRDVITQGYRDDEIISSQFQTRDELFRELEDV